MKGYYCDCKRSIGTLHETEVNSEEICVNCGYYAQYVNDEIRFELTEEVE
jgi:Zn ribbon nucleic-acid-binding protein